MSARGSDDGALDTDDDHEMPETSEEQNIVDGLDSLAIAEDTQKLVDRCRILLDELERFKTYLQSKRKLLRVEHRHFIREIRTDLRALERLNTRSAEGGQSRVSAFHAVKSSNIPFLEAVWSVAKDSRDLVCLKRTGHLVDVVSDGGLKWTKVSTITESRLLMEMANKGWEWQDQMSDGESEDGTSEPSQSDSDDIGLNLYTMAQTLMDSAKKTRIHYRVPTLTLLLTRIEESKGKDIDRVLQSIRALGVTVVCKPSTSRTLLDQNLLELMVPDDWLTFSDTLNIDCTILLALVSDISHTDVAEKEGFNRAIRRQIEIETEEQLLPEVLWPAITGRRLICSSEAAQRMHEIVNTIGTETEKARTELIMGTRVLDRVTLRAELQGLSKHPVPEDLRLPLEKVDFDFGKFDTQAEIAEGLRCQELPASAEKIAAQLSSINSSVFLLGWATNITTITSNRTVAKQVETCVEQNRTSDDDMGPHLWVCPTSRSLVAKEKDRREGKSSFKKH